MEPIPLHGQLLLTEPLPTLLHGCTAFGTLAESVEGFARLRADCDLPAGIVLDCPPVPEEIEPPKTERYITLCKRVFRERLREHAAYYYLRGAVDFRALRAAVLAMTDLCGRSLIAEVTVGEEGRLPDGTDVVAAAGVLQRIGVSTIILAADTAEDLSDAMERVAPYARVSMGVRIPAAWLKKGITLVNAEVFVPAAGEDSETLARALSDWQGAVHHERDHDDVILAPDGRDAHFIDPTTNISDEIECDYDLGERLIEIEDEQAAALKLVIADEEDLLHFEDHLYMLSRPVCLCAPTPELLERGLRIYYGLAIYDGTWEQEPGILKYFGYKYGLVCL